MVKRWSHDGEVRENIHTKHSEMSLRLEQPKQKQKNRDVLAESMKMEGASGVR